MGETNGNSKMWSEVGKPVIGVLSVILLGVLGYVGTKADATAQEARLKCVQLDERVTSIESAFKRYLDEHADAHREMRADIKELLHRTPPK
jgi:hypothetical protein